MAAASIAVSVSMGVMKPVLEKLGTLMGDEYKKIKGLRKEVSFLREELRAMEALLEKMDAADRLDSQAREWRKDIIEMSYDIEDCIDDFMNRVGEAGDKVGLLQKASGFLKTMKDRYRIANQIKKIKARVIQTSKRRERYKLDVCISTPVVVDPRLSALSKDSTNLVGLENQTEELSKWVNAEEQQLKIMSIVGLGGLGKTTLANEVYRQVEEGQFKCMAFVCVSQKPDITKLLKRILFQLGLRQYSHDYFVEQDLVDALKKHLQDKRYFIVVDDLWEMKAWDDIQCAFPQNKYCSRVMITTRDDQVAKRCCGTSGIIYKMKPLSEPGSRKLFFTRIFGSEDDCPSEFEEVSRAILKRCRGLPLAIITVAGILASQQTKLKQAWEYIQTALAPELESNIDYEKMMDILDLSYKHLPLHLKACFLYLGTYPEDHRINSVELVRRWVAEGFVANTAGLDVWDVAESYLNELVNRSMVEPALPYGNEGLISHCRVHDMMLDLILRKCKEDNFLILLNDPHEVTAAGQDKIIRRLTVDFVEDSRMANKTSVGNLSHLRSLTILTRGPQDSMWTPPWLELKFVRVLFLDMSFSQNKVDFFGIINQLSHLRYVKALGGCGSNTVVPTHHQIKGLRFLETLDLDFTFSKVPLDLVDLPRLSHLSVPAGCDMRFPRGIGEMKQLRTLFGFSLEYSSSESIIGLGELTALSKLVLHTPGLNKGVPIVPQWKPIWFAPLYASLEKLNKLRSLEVWGNYYVAFCADPLSLLSPPWAGSLERLHLSVWSFSIVPWWIGHLRSLKELSLGVKQIIQDDISLIGMLPFLIGLHLRVVHVPTTRIVIGRGFFTFVEWFFFNCDGISSLTFEAGAMRNLKDLTLAFNFRDWEDRATPEGLQHLEGLQQIRVHNARCYGDCRPHERDEADVALIRSLFQDTVDVLQTRPVFNFHDGFLRRPKEWDQLEEDLRIQATHDT